MKNKRFKRQEASLSIKRTYKDFVCSGFLAVWGEVKLSVDDTLNGAY